MECLQNVETCLHQARLDSNLDLEALCARTALSPGVLRKLDEGRFEELPGGLYARSYIKSFAAEVGLDPDEALRNVEHLLPETPDPLSVLRELKGPSPSERLFSSVVEKLRPRAVTPKEEAVDLPLLPFSVPSGADTQPAPAADLAVAPATRDRLTRWGAAALDAAVLIAINAGLVLLIAWGSGLTARSLVREDSIALAALCSVPTALYFILFNGIAGRTLGGWLCRLPQACVTHPLTLDDILRRSVLR
jgi:hypothetical protein